MRKLKINEFLSNEELESKSLKCKDETESLRWKAMLMIQKESLSANEVSKRLGVSHEAVRKWVHAFNKSGNEGLRDGRYKNKRGNSFKNDNFLKELSSTIAQKCDDGGTWTGKKLQKWILERYNRHFALSTVYVWMHQLEVSWKANKSNDLKTLRRNN